MFLQIDDNLSVAEVEERFAECFPKLRIRFYSSPHKRFGTTDEEFVLKGSEKIGDVRKLHQNGALEIKSWHTVAMVERKLKIDFGLNAQLFHLNSKGNWVQTSVSDFLTLQEQSAFNDRNSTA